LVVHMRIRYGLTMIVTFTDFGTEGPYLGQMRAVLHALAPDIPVVDLMVDAPAFSPRAAAYLLPAVVAPLPEKAVCLTVVDPGVGSERTPMILYADDLWFVGPDNGIFEMIARRCESTPEWWEITYAPKRISASFHGRDLFAPVAAMLARDGAAALDALARPWQPDRAPYDEWPDDTAEVVYIDGYGNCMLGTRWHTVSPNPAVELRSGTVATARTFSDVPSGVAFCYENALGLIEIAVNQGSAAAQLGLQLGSQVPVRKLSGK